MKISNNWSDDIDNYQDLYGKLGEASEQVCFDFFSSLKSSENFSDVREKINYLQKTGIVQAKEEKSFAPKIKAGDNQIFFQSMQPLKIMNHYRAFKNSNLKAVYVDINIKSKKML